MGSLRALADPVALATAEAAPASPSGIVAGGATCERNVAIDADELLARDGNAGSVLLVQDGAAAGNTQLDATSGQVVSGTSAVPPATVELKGFGTAELGGIVLGTGDRLGRVEFGVAGNCSSHSIGPGPVSVTFEGVFPSTPLVFTQPVEPDQNGCTSVRIDGVSQTGFSLQTWTGGSPQACGCSSSLAGSP